MNTYFVTVEHDAGRFNLEVVALDEKDAIRMVCCAEGCPQNAIIKIKKEMANGQNPVVWPSRLSA